MRLSACLILALLVLAGTAAPAPAKPERRTITVTGTATLQVPNDLASFNFGVQQRRRSASAALSATAVRVRSVLARLAAEGIAPEDLTTDTIRVERVTRTLPGGQERVVEYAATSSVHARVRNVANAGVVASAAVAAGATNVDGPNFTAADPDETGKQALAAAFGQAQDKARRLADAAGVDLEGLISIQEGIEVSPPLPAAGAPASDEAKPRTPPPVRPGTSTVTASVTAVFEID